VDDFQLGDLVSYRTDTPQSSGRYQSQAAVESMRYGRIKAIKKDDNGTHYFISCGRAVYMPDKNPHYLEDDALWIHQERVLDRFERAMPRSKMPQPEPVGVKRG
jgi:hypothetical protein